MCIPIETPYAGYRFRSRLEARWAVFFDVLQLKWRYEPDGFQLPSGRWYLPDFLVDGVGYIEIKPNSSVDNRKIEELGEMLSMVKQRAYCVYGEVPNPYTIEPYGPGTWGVAHGGIMAIGDDSLDYWFAICPRCDSRGVTYQGRYPRLPCGCFKSLLDQPDGDRKWNEQTQPIRIALVAARGMRFEDQA